MEKQLNLIKSGFSQIIIVNTSEIEGFLPVRDEEFYIHLKILEDAQPKKVRFQGSWKLQQLLLPVMEVLEKHLLLCSSVEDMLREIKNAAEQQLSASNSYKIPTLPSVVYYDILLNQLKDVGWNRVSYIDEALNVIELYAIDNSHREHKLRINLPKEFPNENPTYTCDIPEEFSFKWSAKKTLSNLYEYFQVCLQTFQQFWNYLDEIDSETWVLYPENPSRKECTRRIVLVTNGSLLITVNPLSPSAVPICHYLGPEQIVAPLRDKFNRNIDVWDENFSLLSNLKNVLDIDFPSPELSNKEELCVDCGICYSYELEDKLPEIMCNDTKCAQIFHRSCLYKWLRSLPSTRHSFNTIFGECPYCNQPIWCTMSVA